MRTQILELLFPFRYAPYQSRCSSAPKCAMSTKDQMSLDVRPAQLSFLAIFNPSLGSDAEAFRDQIVFYSSRAARLHKARKGYDADASGSQDEEENERLRQ